MTTTPTRPEPGTKHPGSHGPAPDAPVLAASPDPQARFAEAWIAAGADRSRFRYEAGLPPRSENEAKAYEYLREWDQNRTMMAEAQAEEVLLGRWPREECSPEAQHILDAYDPRAGAEPEYEAGQ